MRFDQTAYKGQFVVDNFGLDQAATNTGFKEFAIAAGIVAQRVDCSRIAIIVGVSIEHLRTDWLRD